MNDKAGQMGGGAAWLFPIGAAFVATLVTYLSMKFGLPGKVLYLVSFAVFAGAAFAAVSKTSAGKGTAIGASLVGAVFFAIGGYLVTSMIVAAAASTGIDTTDAAGKANGHVALGEGASAAVGAIGGIIVAFVNFFVAAAGGITGAIAGGKAKTAAAPQEQAYARAA